MKKSFIIIIVIVIAVAFGVFIFGRQEESSIQNQMQPISTNMKISSPVLEHNSAIPKKYTCDGEDVSPELRIEGVPENAKSLALIMDDPDAPGGTFTHWIVLNIDPRAVRLESNFGLFGWSDRYTDGQPATGWEDPSRLNWTQGVNDFGRTGYGGPCPPSGVHRYFFKLYALDARLDELIPKPEEETAPPTKSQVESAMQGHILAQAELIGLYGR